jgi:hypothetical protein
VLLAVAAACAAALRVTLLWTGCLTDLVITIPLIGFVAVFVAGLA